MAAKSLKIDSLELDLENPRITLAADQRDAMQKIINEQKVKLINLAESIAERGFSPMDRCLSSGQRMPVCAIPVVRRSWRCTSSA